MAKLSYTWRETKERVYELEGEEDYLRAVANKLYNLELDPEDIDGMSQVDRDVFNEDVFIVNDRQFYPSINNYID